MLASCGRPSLSMPSTQWVLSKHPLQGGTSFAVRENGVCSRVLKELEGRLIDLENVSVEKQASKTSGFLIELPQGSS